MNFTYDDVDDTCYIHLHDGAVSLVQEFGGDWRITVTITNEGTVLGLDIKHPGATPWPIKEILERYPLNVYDAYVLVTLAERYTMFRF